MIGKAGNVKWLQESRGIERKWERENRTWTKGDNLQRIWIWTKVWNKGVVMIENACKT